MIDKIIKNQNEAVKTQNADTPIHDASGWTDKELKDFMPHRRNSDGTSSDRVRQVNFKSSVANNLPDSFHVVGNTKATLYGKRTKSNGTALTEQRPTHQPSRTYPTVEETNRYIAELDRISGERDTADIAAQQNLQEEKRRSKDRKRMEYERSRLLPQWKVTPGIKFGCSKQRKLTAMEIMDLIEDGTFTN